MAKPTCTDSVFPTLLFEGMKNWREKKNQKTRPKLYAASQCKITEKKVLMIYDNDWNVTQAVQMELFAFFVAPLIRLTVYHLGAVFLYFSHPGGWPTTFLMSITS